jgi:hypothetical protein
MRKDGAAHTGATAPEKLLGVGRAAEQDAVLAVPQGAPEGRTDADMALGAPQRPAGACKGGDVRGVNERLAKSSLGPRRLRPSRRYAILADTPVARAAQLTA